MTKSDAPDIRGMGQEARKAATRLAISSGETRDTALFQAAHYIENDSPNILEANARDMAFAVEKGISPAMLDRLQLDEKRIRGISESLRAIAQQDDPLGEVLASWTQPSGLEIQRVSTPIGVIGVIFESRPNVTADAGALCLKSGNAVILRCGSESLHSSSAIHACLVNGLKDAGLPETAIQLVQSRDRQAVGDMLRLTDLIDVIIPRGGKGLVERVRKEARIPVFAHLEGICHIYIDEAADAEKAHAIVLNAKTRRPGICGAAECLLVHTKAAELGQSVVDALLNAGVEVYARGLEGTRPALDGDFGTEFLDMKIAARKVTDINQAIDHIRCFGSGHTDAIVSEDLASVETFFSGLDSAILMHNASTQFADGGEFGMGAEIGIATGKLHARGPVGAKQLTSFKYLVRGHGAIRP